MKKTLSMALLGAVAFGFLAIATPEPAFAGKGGKGKPKPPPPHACGCAEVIVFGDIVCVLEDCGLDCVYVCTGL